MLNMSQPGTSSVSELKAQCQEFEKADERRLKLIHHLFTLIEQSERSVTHLEDTVERLEKHEGYDRATIKELKQANKNLEERLDTAPFVVVLVDGDNTLFLDEFVKAGASGGHDAAHLLDNHLKEYFKEICGFKQHWQLVVRIFANFSGLTKAYCEAGVVSDPRLIRDFLVALNREFPLFEFVDAGGDKEAADKKIQENFRLYHCIEHCKHVILASSGDRGYVSFLRPYSADTARVSLLKSLPFPPDFKLLADNFKVIEFSDVFKVDKLKPHVRDSSAENNNQFSYAAAMLSSARAAPTSSSTSQQSELASISVASLQESAQGRKMWFNKHGQRLDEPLTWDPERIKSLMPAKLCLRYFLDKCERTKEECPHGHEYRGKSTLNQSDQQALLRIARSRPCYSGLYCADKNCLHGHECVHGTRCAYGAGCKFSEEMHNVDKEGRYHKVIV